MPTVLPLSPELTAATTLVVLAAGRGQRFGGWVPKHLTEIHGVPLIVRLLNQCSASFTSAPVVVVRGSDDHTATVLSRWNLKAHIVVQARTEGTVPAVLAALPVCAENVCVVLADLVVDGQVRGMISCQPAIVVWPDAPAEATRKNFGVQIQHSTVVRVVEKPQDVTGLTCGIGVYIVSADLLRTFAHQVGVDHRGEQGITDLLATLVAAGVTLAAHEFDGIYVNVNDQDDLINARQWVEPA